jgi:hypothetical protein
MQYARAAGPMPFAGALTGPLFGIKKLGAVSLPYP